MPSSTKAAIVSSFLRLSAKRPPDKITVRDIVDDCGVNRNTFYYHFQDIYAVMEALCGALLDSLPQEEPPEVTLSAFFSAFLSFCHEHPAASRSLVLSLGYEGLERYFGKRLDGVIADTLARAKGTPPSPLACRCIRHALLGLCLDAARAKKGEQLPSPDELCRLIAAAYSHPERKQSYEAT